MFLDVKESIVKFEKTAIILRGIWSRVELSYEKYLRGEKGISLFKNRFNRDIGSLMMV